MKENYELIDNEERHQYEFHIERYVPRIEYIKNKDGVIYLTHTEVPMELGGKGIGSQLVEKVLLDIEKKDLRLVPLCRSWIYSEASGLETHRNERHTCLISITKLYGKEDRIYEW